MFGRSPLVQIHTPFLEGWVLDATTSSIGPLTQANICFLTRSNSLVVNSAFLAADVILHDYGFLPERALLFDALFSLF